MSNYSKHIYVALFFVQSIFIGNSLCQGDSTLKKDLFAPRNILSFADFLFCQKDYLRAVSEYEKYLEYKTDDSVKFKIGLSYLNMNMYDKAEDQFHLLEESSCFSSRSKNEIAITKFLKNDFNGLQKYYEDYQTDNETKKAIKRIYYYSLLYGKANLPGENEFVNTFPDSSCSTIRDFYLRKGNMPHRSPILAAIFSTIIPGAGKIYAGEYSDGITSTIINGVLAFVAYDNFKHNHKFRGWMWGTMTALFYAGNIYGSASAAQIFNARINFNFTFELNSFIKKQNYFLLGDDEFCR